MTGIRKINTIFLLLILSASLAIASGHVDDKNKKKKKKTKTTTAVKKNDDTTQIILAKKPMPVADSMVMFPSHDLYCSWDTSVIHPHYFEKEFMTDSVVINLLDEWNCGFTIPRKGPVTSGYGWRRRRPHFGTDINLETGDTVVAAFEGKVRIAKMNRGYGNVVIIRHKNGLETVYAHLSKILVQAEQDVKSGDVIGLGGNTGHSYGSHLHFEMRYLGKAIDTEDLIDYDKLELKNTSFVLYKEDFKSSYDLHNMPVSNRGTTKSHTTTSQVSSSKGKTKYYVVKKGDTLGKIAQKMHTSIKAICAKNGIKQTKILQPGQRLKV